MISQQIWRSLSVGVLVICGAIFSSIHPVLAGNVEISEDKLNTEKSLSWGGEGLPFNELVTVRDSLVNSTVGKVVIDRHGEDNSTEQSTGMLAGLTNALNVRAPFAGPRPGRMTIVTLWGSKEEGCFVKAMIHNAPKGGGSQNFVPMKMEVGVGTQVIKLTPIAKSAPKVARGTYTYTNYTKDDKVERTAPVYFTENTFAVNAKVADLLRNAPAGDAKVRLTASNNETKVFAIGQKNVAQWRESYAYNPTCKAKN
jgi:hypothetical protein